MTLLGELERLGRRLGADAERLGREGEEALAGYVTTHPQPLFELLRKVKPVLVVHGMAIVTRYDDVVAVLRNDEAFGVEPYRRKMESLLGDFILGLESSPAYERQVSILRLAAPRSDVPGMAAFVAGAAEALVAAGHGRIEVPDLARQVPARVARRWLGPLAGDDEALIAATLAMFEDIFVNLKNDAGLHAAAVAAEAALRPQVDAEIARRQGAGGGGDDVLGRLVAMQGSPATALSDAQVAAGVVGLAVGFIPPVMTAVTLALDALLDRPAALAGAQAAARAGDDEGVRAHMWEAMRLAPQGPGLFRRALTDAVLAEGTRHATPIKAGTLTFAATQSAMLDAAVLDDPEAFRVDRPAHHYLHFGTGLHTCFGRYVNAMQIPLIAKPLLRRENLARVPGQAGTLVKRGPYPASLAVTFDE